MRALLIAFCLASALPLAAQTELQTALAAVARYAAKFDAAAGWAAQETMIQKGFETPRHHLLRAEPLDVQKPEMVTREFVNLYGFTSDPSIHEVRAIAAIDGKARKPPRGLFESAIAQDNTGARRKLMEEFQRESIDVAANDFGPLVLLFTRGQQPNYEFMPAGTSLIGAEKVMVIRYRQNTGAAALHLKDGSHNATEPLRGQIEVRLPDFTPLRVTLTSTRHDVRDEAEVDYVLQTEELVLPASVVYRRYVHDELTAEDRSRFTDWHRLTRSAGLH